MLFTNKVTLYFIKEQTTHGKDQVQLLVQMARKKYSLSMVPFM